MFDNQSMATITCGSKLPVFINGPVDSNTDDELEKVYTKYYYFHYAVVNCSMYRFSPHNQKFVKSKFALAKICEIKFFVLSLAVRK